MESRVRLAGAARPSEGDDALECSRLGYRLDGVRHEPVSCARRHCHILVKVAPARRNEPLSIVVEGSDSDSSRRLLRTVYLFRHDAEVTREGVLVVVSPVRGHAFASQLLEQLEVSGDLNMSVRVEA